MHCVPAVPLFAWKHHCIYPHFLYHIFWNITTLFLLLCPSYQRYCSANIWHNLTVYSIAVFNRPQLPQKCAFACNCWFAFPYFPSFLVSVEHTPMWSSFLCLYMIRQYVTAVMICSLTVRGPSQLQLLSQLRLPLLGDRWSVWLIRAVWMCVLISAWVYGDLVAEA